MKTDYKHLTSLTFRNNIYEKNDESPDFDNQIVKDINIVNRIIGSENLIIRNKDVLVKEETDCKLTLVHLKDTEIGVVINAKKDYNFATVICEHENIEKNLTRTPSLRDLTIVNINLNKKCNILTQGYNKCINKNKYFKFKTSSMIEKHEGTKDYLYGIIKISSKIDLKNLNTQINIV